MEDPSFIVSDRWFSFVLWKSSNEDDVKNSEWNAFRRVK